MRADSTMLHGAVVVVLLTALSLGCGDRQTVAEKSAEAFRDAQAKGTPVGGGHDHDRGHALAGEGTAANGTTGHEGHGTSADPHAGMVHGATADGGTASADPAQHRGHDPQASAHAGHRGASTSDPHAGHAASPEAHAQHGGTQAAGGHDAHAGHRATARDPHAGHRATARDEHAGHRASAQDAHAGHRLGSPAADHAQHTTAREGRAAHDAHREPAATHAQHGVAQPQQHDAHRGHTAQATEDSSSAATVDHSTMDHSTMDHGMDHVATQPATLAVPVSSSMIAQTEPAGTLEPDRFDAAVPISVAEARKAAAAMSHEGHTMAPPSADAPASSPAVHEHDGQAETSYVCPMHPEVTSDRPGNCPKCGMALVPVNPSNEDQE